MARLWMPDWPPASADDKDDEFDNSSVAVAWTEWDPGSFLTVSEAAYGLSLLQANNTATKLAGIFKAIPADDWAVWVKVSLLGLLNAGSASVGLLLGQDLTNNPNTSDVYFLRLSNTNNACEFTLQYWTQWDTYSAATVTLSDVIIGTHAYLRIRKASTTYGFDFSSDGVGWQQLHSGTLAFAPAEFGLGVYNRNTGVNCRGVVQFFRVVDGTPALTDVMGGQRVL